MCLLILNMFFLSRRSTVSSENPTIWRTLGILEGFGFWRWVCKMIHIEGLQVSLSLFFLSGIPYVQNRKPLCYSIYSAIFFTLLRLCTWIQLKIIQILCYYKCRKQHLHPRFTPKGISFKKLWTYQWISSSYDLKES